VLPLLPPTPVRQAESAVAAVTVPLHKKGGKVEEGWQGWAGAAPVGPRAFERVDKPSSQKANAACDLAAHRA
jgi:hypothetical protein